MGYLVFLCTLFFLKRGGGEERPTEEVRGERRLSEWGGGVRVEVDAEVEGGQGEKVTPSTKLTRDDLFDTGTFDVSQE